MKLLIILSLVFPFQFEADAQITPPTIQLDAIPPGSVYTDSIGIFVVSDPEYKVVSYQLFNVDKNEMIQSRMNNEDGSISKAIHSQTSGTEVQIIMTVYHKSRPALQMSLNYFTP